ncbi:hypothetical protein R1flu_026561 [Riccia fluitans]|uniref:Uncharacterized protein n=1 Tax=Riccia fluitans TaxID=41844 RepID=A0ABD1XG95_9MARC
MYRRVATFHELIQPVGDRSEEGPSEGLPPEPGSSPRLLNPVDQNVFDFPVEPGDDRKLNQDSLASARPTPDHPGQEAQLTTS